MSELGILCTETNIFQDLPIELRRMICDILLGGEKYQKLAKYLEYKAEKCFRIPEHNFSSGISLDEFNEFFKESIGDYLLCDSFNPEPPHNVGHVSHQDRPLYYQKSICAIWMLYNDLDPNFNNDHIKNTVIELISNICYDYIMHFAFYEELEYQHLFEEDCLYEAIYLFVNGLFNGNEKEVDLMTNDNEDSFNLIDKLDRLNELYNEKNESPYYRLNFYYHIY